MSEFQRVVGRARVTLLNGGDIRANMREWLAAPDVELPPETPGELALPVQCVHVALDDASVLIDAPRFDPADAPPGYQPPPDIETQLRAIGAPPESITHVLITHPHTDHFNALLDPEGQHLTFPNAFHYINRNDWAYAEARASEDSAYAKAFEGLKRVFDANLLMRISGDRQIAPGIFALAAPGETPGHQIARVHSDGQTFYALGDLYHHPLEVSHNLVVYWADAPTKRASRAGFCLAALNDDPTLCATHIRGFGRLAFTAETIDWVASQR
jgi:glyoxylase-like metal-dependent hydrolase (beta-lactamase superfamily II)